MKRIIFFLIVILLSVSNGVFAENTGKEINNKCRKNLKALNEATESLAKSKEFFLPQWISYEQAIENLNGFENALDGKVIKSPTIDCKYFLVCHSNSDYQWLCDLHGLLDGDKTISFRYKEHQLQGKTSEHFKDINKYKEHTKRILHWTEYTPTPIESFKYHYNMNPITTTLISVIVVAGVFFTLKTFFRF